MPDNRVHFTKLEELNPWNVAFEELPFYKWLQENFSKDKTCAQLSLEYLDTIGYDEWVHKITQRDIDFFWHIIGVYEERNITFCAPEQNSSCNLLK